MEIHPPGLTPIQASVKVAEKKKKMPKMPQVRSWKQKQTVASSKYCCGSSDPGCAATWHSLHADGFKSSGMCGKKDEEVEMNSFEEMIELYNVEYDGWIEGVDGIDYLEFTVDSGAADTVGNDGMAPDSPVVPSEGSMNGVKYIAAAGHTIPNEGEKNLSLESAEGHMCGLKVQMAKVRKALLSVSKICDAGHEVKFTRTGGTITHCTTGQVIRFRRTEGVYRLRLKIRKADESGFTRPGN